MSQPARALSPFLGIICLLACGSTDPTPAVADTTPPVVTFTGPAAGHISGLVSFSATAQDSAGIVRFVQFRANGVVWHTDSTSPYSYQWNADSFPVGTYSWDAQAKDRRLNTGTSTAIVYTVP